MAARLTEHRIVAVQFVGLFFDIGVNQHDGVDCRTVLVVRFNAFEVLDYQGAAGEPAGLHGGVDLGDGGFLDFEGRRPLAEEGNGGEEQTGRSADHQTIV